MKAPVEAPDNPLLSVFDAHRIERARLVQAVTLLTGPGAQLEAWREAVSAGGGNAIDALPAFPGTATKLMRLLEQTEPQPEALIEIIEGDLALAVQVLRLANSAAYVRGIEISTVKLAVTRLGVDTVTAVALAATTKTLLDSQENKLPGSFRERWQNLSGVSLRVANASMWLSRELRRGSPKEAFLAGLTLDLGKAVSLLIACQLLENGALPRALSSVALDWLLEETHVSLGIDLAGRWDLPGYITHVCAHHHAAKPEAARINDVLHVVRVVSGADSLVHGTSVGDELVDQFLWSADVLAIDPVLLKRTVDKLKASSFDPGSGLSPG